MEYNKDLIKLVQKELNEETNSNLKIDGQAGKYTLRALLYITLIPSHWSVKRQVIGYFQYLCATEGIDAGPIDGYWGPSTENGYETYIDNKEKKVWKPWRDPETDGKGVVVGGTNKLQWPMQTHDELLDFYGAVGTNQTSVKVPYTLKLAWNIRKRVTKVTCHKKIAESFLTIMEDVKEIYGKDIPKLGLDLYAGCLNVRKIRGGTTWSTHSWGIAFDFDSAHNKLRWGKDRARFGKSDYKEWFDAWEKQGAVSLGRAKNYDWMHTQFARLRKK